MVTIKFKGHRSFFTRTDGGLSVAFNPGEVHTFDENHKRYKEFCKRLLAQPDIFEVQTKVGAKGIGGGVRTRRKASRKPKKEIKSPKSVIDKVKKPKGLRRPKRKTK